ncbi:conserved exported protein of unknown function [Hyphomicrobium sp. MC1]|uniref:hypothetical protein n=1 Tax=Hyphomicrobium sp. 802 TaxID=1112272 RepID=UPI000213D8BF|nr:hypothetical protein [Hyphomicrobium sp. 802]CCB66941.1 conserved exported protein of unknown function [Hyphomicrobium sp. MC1]
MRLTSVRNFAIAPVILSMISAASAQEPNFGAYAQAAFFPFLDANDGELRRSPSLGISFGERFHRATLDTGSTGVVVGATSIPNIDQLPRISEGQLTYTSSGRVMRGHWVRTAFTIVGSGDSAIQVEAMPVLAVERVDCLPRARDCDPNEDVSRIAMIGIGFAREGDRQSQSTPDKNPFLHVVSNNSRQRHGYVLTARGVYVGLSAVNTSGHFEYVKLDRNKEDTDWSPIPACISINGKTPPACGTLLVDSGVGSAFMTLPPWQSSQAKLQPGDQVAVAVSRGQSSLPLYSFKIDDGHPLTPEKVHLRLSPDRTFLNTSFHFLNGFDFLYDADGGYVGFRRRSTGTQAIR